MDLRYKITLLDGRTLDVSINDNDPYIAPAGVISQLILNEKPYRVRPYYRRTINGVLTIFCEQEPSDD